MLFITYLEYLVCMVAKQLSLLHGRVDDSNTLLYSLSHTMRSLIKDAITTCCSYMFGHFGLIRNEFYKFFLLKFEFLHSFNTFDVCHIFRERVDKRCPNTVIALS